MDAARPRQQHRYSSDSVKDTQWRYMKLQSSGRPLQKHDGVEKDDPVVSITPLSSGSMDNLLNQRCRTRQTSCRGSKAHRGREEELPRTQSLRHHMAQEDSYHLYQSRRSSRLNSMSTFETYKIAQTVPQSSCPPTPMRRSSIASTKSTLPSRNPGSSLRARQFQSLDGTIHHLVMNHQSFSATTLNEVPQHQSDPERHRTHSVQRSLSLPPPDSHTTVIATLPPRSRHSRSTPCASKGHASARPSRDMKSSPFTSETSLPTSTPSVQNPARNPSTATITLEWTSPATRRAEYSKIDASHSGLRGLWKKTMPKCFHHRRARRNFYSGKTHEDGDSVRRFRIDIEEEEDEIEAMGRRKEEGSSGVKVDNKKAAWGCW